MKSFQWLCEASKIPLRAILEKFSTYRKQSKNQYKLKDLLAMDQTALANVPDAEVERAIFGVASMKDVIEIDTDDIEPRKEDYNLALQTIEEEGPEFIKDIMNQPLIVDLTRNGDFRLNDGHHRYIIGTEHDYQTEFSSYV